ncbi:MAG: hypothetical protein A07HR60_02203 [uncultured archaeon A07HR60]|nr:MAG: hypothetical protein A07HR60_02203 [uncultured archaeon A07HR60]
MGWSRISVQSRRLVAVHSGYQTRPAEAGNAAETRVVTDLQTQNQSPQSVITCHVLSVAVSGSFLPRELGSIFGGLDRHESDDASHVRRAD